MKSFTTKKYLIIAGLALVLSLVIIRWHSKDNVPFCVNSAGCDARETLRGEVTTTTYGFPATYRQVETFKPANTNPSSGGYAGYKEATTEVQGFSLFKVITNLVFWGALLYVLGDFVKPRQKKPTTTPVTPEPASSLPPEPKL